MKTKKLRPWARTTFTCTACFLFIFLGSLNDFSLNAIPLIVVLFILLGLNIKLLEKY